MNSDRIKLLDQFIKEEPNDPFNHYALAMEYYDYDSQKALTILKKVIMEHPTYLPSYFKAANLLLDMEKLEEAKEIFEKGMSLASDQKNEKALSELKAAYQNLLFELD